MQTHYTLHYEDFITPAVLFIRLQFAMTRFSVPRKDKKKKEEKR